LKETLKHPATLGALLLCAAYPFFLRYVLGVWHWSAVPLAVAAMTAWFFLLSRVPDTGRPASMAVLANGADEEAEAVGREFAALGHSEGQQQVADLLRKYRNLTNVLSMRLSPSEVSYSRYLGMANTVCHGAIENLRDIVIGLRNMDGIAPHAGPKRFSDLRGERFEIPEEIRATTNRKALYKEEHDRLVALLGETEGAMTAIDRAATALARTRTERLTDMDLADAMKELEDLSGKAGRLSAK